MTYVGGNLLSTPALFNAVMGRQSYIMHGSVMDPSNLPNFGVQSLMVESQPEFSGPLGLARRRRGRGQRTTMKRQGNLERPFAAGSFQSRCIKFVCKFGRAIKSGDSAKRATFKKTGKAPNRLHSAVLTTFLQGCIVTGYGC